MVSQFNINTSTKKMIIMSLFIAITVILASTPIGVITLPTISFTIAQIPTIIISIVLGPLEGAIVGFVFGLTMMFIAFTRPVGILDPYFMNPLVSVAPRILIGVTTYFSYKFILKFNYKLSLVVGVAVGSLTNTIGCLGMLYILYFKEVSQDFNEVGISAIKMFFIIIFTNGLLEMLSSVIISYFIIMSLKRVKII